MTALKIDKEKYPYCYSGHQYALDVMAGKIPNSKYIIGACSRYLSDLSKKEYIFDLDKAERYLKLVQKFNHVKGKGWKSENILYEPWQNFCFMNIMGWVNPATNERRFRVAHVEVPRGQGKSLMASQSVLYFLALDNPRGNEISVASTKSEQSRIVLDSARAMARGCPEYLKATGVEVLAHKIVHTKSNSFARALSSDSKSLDGLNDVLCVIDELHAVSRELFDVIYSGMKKRNDSLLLCITTSGYNNDGVGYSQSQYAKKVATGQVNDDTFFSAVFTIDEGDDIYDENTWKKANPNYGISVDPVSFRATVEKAKVTPSDLPNLKVKNLNVWLTGSSSLYDQSMWDKCANEKLKIEDFAGQKCYAATDVSSKIDLTSNGYMFKKDGIYYFFEKSFIPEATVKEVNSVIYDNCIASGHLHQTPGEAINFETIEQDVIDKSKAHNIASWFFDPWNAVQLSQNLTKNYVNVVEFRMTTANLSEPTKMLEALIRQKKIYHNGSPLLRWCIGNVVGRPDNNGNLFPRKENEKNKIDPIITLLMCLAGWMQDNQDESYYESNDILFL